MTTDYDSDSHLSPTPLIFNKEMKKGAAVKSQDEGIIFIDDIKFSNKQTYANIEFIIIGVGTLIWGYADLINELIC